MIFGANRCLTIKTKNEMKKNLFMVATVALMALVSCNKEEINNNVVEQPQEEPMVIVEFEAGFDVETKTALDADGKKTLWKSDDRISINGQEFTVSEIKEDGKAIFVNVSKLPEDFAAPFTAIYPYGSDGSVSAKQDAVAGNFDPKAVIEKATSDNYSLSFKNETSLLKFQVEAACDAVTLSSDDDLATGSKTVTINGDFKTGETYYVAVLPGTKKNFVVRIDGYLSRNAASVTINRSTIANMKTLPAPVASTYKIMGINGDWNTGLTLYKDVDCYVLKNVSITASTEFKFCQGSNWGRPITLALGKWAYTYDVDGNLKTTAGSYDIYVSAANDAVCLVKSGEAMPKYASANKQLHLMLEGDDNCGLYMWSPSGTGLDNWDAAWKNYYGKIKMKQNASTWTEYYAFVVPSVAVDKSCKFLFKWYGGQSCDYTKTINTDLPFWRNGGNDGSYSFSSKIAID